jgi:hypothetical protein
LTRFGLDQLIPIARYHSYEAGQSIVTQGASKSIFCIVVQGTCKATFSSKPKEVKDKSNCRNRNLGLRHTCHEHPKTTNLHPAAFPSSSSSSLSSLLTTLEATYDLNLALLGPQVRSDIEIVLISRKVLVCEDDGDHDDENV